MNPPIPTASVASQVAHHLPHDPTKWREVTKEEFYADMGPRNVHPSPIGKYPYTTLWYTPERYCRGKSVPQLPFTYGCDLVTGIVSRVPGDVYYLPV